jgi:16S rRNA A1518/A1519 N6-dimethyltransferase RsmA/KsgA/DIM1 with predicted DNA glycosylase/AP lyase activity
MMATQRMKLDYNHLMEIIDDFLGKVGLEDEENNVFSIGMGLNLLTAYLKEIAERAIETNDDVLIELLKDLCILKEKGGDAE